MTIESLSYRIFSYVSGESSLRTYISIFNIFSRNFCCDWLVRYDNLPLVDTERRGFDLQSSNVQQVDHLKNPC